MVEEYFYLGGLEWYRRWSNADTAKGPAEEIETLHLVDGEKASVVGRKCVKY